MGKRGFFIAIAALVMSVIIWGNPLDSLMKALTPPAPSAVTALVEESSQPRLTLTVEADRLMSHVEAIALPRFTAAEKAVIRRYITTALSSYGLAATEQPYGTADRGGINIVAEMPGQDSNAEVVILGAHYDTLPNSPGADDNGSAIATLLEAARLLSAQPIAARPAATLRLVFFDQEEQQADGSGLLGSSAFTEVDSNLTGVSSAVILDMVGYACRTEGCQTYPLRLPVQDLPETGEFLAVLGLKAHPEPIDAFVLSARSSWPLVLSLPIPRPTLNLFPDLLRSDHAPFWEKNIPTVFVTDTANFRNPYYHTEQDTLDTIDPSFFRGSAQHVVNAIAQLLNQASD